MPYRRRYSNFGRSRYRARSRFGRTSYRRGRSRYRSSFGRRFLRPRMFNGGYGRY